MLLVLAVSLAGLLLDPRIITGAPAWLKPMKFAISISIYCFTLLWMLTFVRGRPRLVGLVSWVTAIALLVEMVLIAGAAALGTTSHFNVSTPTHAAVWDTMTQETPQQERAADRAGIEESPIQGAHAVGVEDGGPGLPVTGWSTTGGDLRVPHFVGLHGLQALPLFGYLLAFAAPAWLGRRHRVALVWTAGLSYLGLVWVLTWQALRGQPVISPDARTLGTLCAVLLTAGTAVFAVVLQARRGRRR